MKNVNGVEVFKSREEKVNFYDNLYKIHRNNIIYEYNEFINSHLKGKDDFFKGKLIPFVQDEGLRTALDVGADDGRYSILLNEAGLLVTALEISNTRIEKLNKILDTYGFSNIISTMVGDIETEDIDDYDIIICSDLIEHLVDYKAAWYKAIKHSKYVYALIPKGDSWNWSPDHLHRFDSEEIDELCNMSNGIIARDIVDFDEQNSWYALIVRGNL